MGLSPTEKSNSEGLWRISRELYERCLDAELNHAGTLSKDQQGLLRSITDAWIASQPVYRDDVLRARALLRQLARLPKA